VPSSPPLRISPLRPNIALFTESVWRRRTPSTWPLLASQTRVEPSASPATTRRPSGLNAALRRALAWPAKPGRRVERPDGRPEDEEGDGQQQRAGQQLVRPIAEQADRRQQQADGEDGVGLEVTTVPDVVEDASQHVAAI
jgi:hypothetical protein